ncbi:hypothetical protein PF005_g9974 [Phytophthora fragariae]|uniref:Uncharacterized protein n=1 Tax=Phytophthora fragariae TaxID=53985 RepID=A0A6A3Y8Y9_9STRA|nr:hypothetical protein PF003_g6347 [Phytophthora fragariae]KAE8942979.1 hypothetical protein PF009_g7285 [Phytophthora fragariae]KAE9126494.1 hypothetical protein PF007_g5955 [Phytophthora fragariae]KAE9151262.1 hypothetical protein PF006_g4449 [Phytophthora fragariae]KAE9214070.1 hypothetical protein PF005_g9974 [Phytophthora fragariae]
MQFDQEEGAEPMDVDEEFYDALGEEDAIAEWVDRGKLVLEYVLSAKNVADIFTKALGPCAFERLRDELNLEDVQEAVLKC